VDSFQEAVMIWFPNDSEPLIAEHKLGGGFGVLAFSSGLSWMQSVPRLLETPPLVYMLEGQS